jgi:hypothetical protein
MSHAYSLTTHTTYELLLCKFSLTRTMSSHLSSIYWSIFHVRAPYSPCLCPMSNVSNALSFLVRHRIACSHCSVYHFINYATYCLFLTCVWTFCINLEIFWGGRPMVRWLLFLLQCYPGWGLTHSVQRKTQRHALSSSDCGHQVSYFQAWEQ